MMEITCKCGSQIGCNHPSFRGLLVNEIASLGSTIVQQREQLKALRSKRFSKAFREEGDRDRALVAQIDRDLPVLEGRFYGLRFLEGELFGGKTFR